MDIAGISMALSQIKTQSDVGTAVLSKTLDTEESVGNQIVNMIDKSAMELSVNPNIGSNVNLYV